MDVGRARFIAAAATAAAADRVRILYPEAPGRRRPGRCRSTSTAKLLIVDDRLLCLGSANLAHRSLGLDTEICLAIEAALATTRPSRARRSGACATRCWPSTWRRRPRRWPIGRRRPPAGASSRCWTGCAAGSGALRLRLPTWLRHAWRHPARLADLDEPLTPAPSGRASGNAAAAPAWPGQPAAGRRCCWRLMVGLGVLARSERAGRPRAYRRPVRARGPPCGEPARRPDRGRRLRPRQPRPGAGDPPDRGHGRDPGTAGWLQLRAASARSRPRA